MTKNLMISRQLTPSPHCAVAELFLLLSASASSSSAVEAKRSSSSSASIIGDELSLLSSSSFFKSRPNYYAKRPPHDTKLYDILGIAPNATVLDVQKAHRKRSLLYHPDKIPPSQAIEAKLKLDKISHAYSILNNDQSRLLYHRYGIVDGNEEYILRLLLWVTMRLLEIMTQEKTRRHRVSSSLMGLKIMMK